MKHRWQGRIGTQENDYSPKVNTFCSAPLPLCVKHEHMKFSVSATFLAIFFFTLVGCLADKGELVLPPPPTLCDSLNVTYMNTMKTIIDQSCAFVGCHVAGHPGGDFTSFQSMQSFGSLSASQIGEQVSSGNMPLGNPLPDSVKVLFQCWEESGFPIQ